MEPLPPASQHPCMACWLGRPGTTRVKVRKVPERDRNRGKRLVGESGQVPSKARLSKATSFLRNSVKELEFALRIPSLPPPLGAPPPTHTLQLLKCIRSILKLVTLFAK